MFRSNIWKHYCAAVKAWSKELFIWSCSWYQYNSGKSYSFTKVGLQTSFEFFFLSPFVSCANFFFYIFQLKQVSFCLFFPAEGTVVYIAILGTNLKSSFSLKMQFFHYYMYNYFFTQEEVFGAVGKKIVEGCVAGYNGTIFA